MFKISFVGGLVVGLLGIGFLLSFSPNMALARTCSCSWSETTDTCDNCDSSGCDTGTAIISGSCAVSAGDSSCSYAYRSQLESEDENSVSEPYYCYSAPKRSGTCSSGTCYPTCADLNCDCGCVGTNSSLACVYPCNNDTYATLDVSTSGAGSGVVGENVASNKRINCSHPVYETMTDCSETNTNSDLSIELLAFGTADIANSVFTGWSGGD